MPRADPVVEDGPNTQGTRVVSYTESLGGGIIFDARCLLDEEHPLDGSAAAAAVERHADTTKALAAQDGKPVEVSFVHAGDCPGYDGFLGASRGGVELRTRMLRARDRTFVLVFTGPPHAATTDLWRTYVDSFRSRLCE